MISRMDGERKWHFIHLSFNSIIFSGSITSKKQQNIIVWGSSSRAKSLKIVALAFTNYIALTNSFISQSFSVVIH